jgi:hypothetical protein
MPYYIEKDTNLKRVVAEGVDNSGNPFRETESVVYPTGAVVYEQDIAPETLDRLKNGDNDHLNSLVSYIDEDEAAKILAERGQTPPVAPEHEAEAEVLHQDGKAVLTREEVTESNPNGDALQAEDVLDEEVAKQDEEGRASADPDSLRVTEIDDKRRGDAAAVQAEVEEKSVADLRKEAADLQVEGRSNMNREELEAAIVAARTEGEGDSQEG